MSVRRADLITLAGRCSAVMAEVVVSGLARIEQDGPDKIKVYLGGRIRMQELVEQCEKLIKAAEKDGYS